MARCYKCGNRIEFRRFKGRAIPLHLYGGCVDRRYVEPDYKLVDGVGCSNDSCPDCGVKTLSLRYRHGSEAVNVLPKFPWYEHLCSRNGSASQVKESLVPSSALHEIELGSSQHLLIGVVKSAHYLREKAQTKIVFETVGLKDLQLVLTYRAIYLAGKVCVYNKHLKTIRPVDALEFCWVLALDFKKYIN